MSDEPNAGGAPPSSQGGTPAAQPAAPQTARQDQQANPRSRGTSPARDAREAAAGVQQTEPVIKIGDQEYPAETVRDAIARKIESDTRKAALPAAPDKYEVKLPANFKAPDGIQFEFSKTDPLLAQARQAAFEEGLSQPQFEKMLGIFGASRVAEQQTIATARAAELQKLGAAAETRLNAITTWANAKLGKEKGAAIAQMLVAARQVEAFEALIGQFSNQGSTPFSQSHREQQGEPGRIPGYDGMNFLQRRAAQDARNDPTRR